MPPSNETTGALPTRSIKVGLLRRGKLAIRMAARRFASMRLSRLKAHAAALMPLEVPSGRAVVIAPHPDDEVFACGGVIAQKVKAAEDVHVIFVTRGEHARGSLAAGEEERAGAARMMLAEKALRVLGVTPEKVHCLGLRDGAVPFHDSPEFVLAAEEMRRLLESIGPDLVFVPHEMDFHGDHIASSQITAAALAASPVLQQIRVFCFPTWMLHTLRTKDLLKPIRGRVIKVNISAECAAKKAAIDAYVTGDGARNEFGQALIGDLPADFITSFTTDHEIYFCR